MGLVTFLPRMIPLVLLQEVRLPKFWQGVLKNVPFAILGALIFPAVFFIHEEHVYFGIIGALIAFILAFLGANVIVVVVGSVIILSLVTLII